MSEELGQSSVQVCELCEQPSDTTKWRDFVDPYSKQIEEFRACDDCYRDVVETARAAWVSDFGICESPQLTEDK